MSHALAVLPLRAALAAARAAQPPLPGRAGEGLARAARLHLEKDERPAEAAIDAFRLRLRRSTETVEVVDYGAGTKGGKPPERAVSEIYKRAATGPAWGRFLFGLARGLRPAHVLELGTNLGIGAAHLAAALALNEGEGGPEGQLVTLEGAPALAARAAGALARLGHGVGDDGCRVRVVVGPFAETLPEVAAGETWDLVFIDGHHEAAAALRYLDILRPHLAPGAVVILDDVEPGRPVREAWEAVKESGPSFYAGKYGLWVAEGAPTAAARETDPAPPPAAAG
ncbi:O-methyltransferase [Rubrivirga sp. IMCC45206]|uniref:O-methyltransferase n=1 Tax=Rubrivirga sp. IMCC45206 TaxID=3391614 RepID=UPI0039901018